MNCRENSVVEIRKTEVTFSLKYGIMELPYDPAIPLLGIHTEETRIERDTCTPMFIAALFISSFEFEKLLKGFEGTCSCQTIYLYEFLFCALHMSETHTIMPPLLANCMNFDLKWVMSQFQTKH